MKVLIPFSPFKCLMNPNEFDVILLSVYIAAHNGFIFTYMS